MGRYTGTKNRENEKTRIMKIIYARIPGPIESTGEMRNR
jgi:hypothetical protein